MVKPEITQLFLTNNNCYKTGKKMTPKGIMRHSTGANNKKLSRYVGPDDGILGVNPYGNHWNTPKPGGRNVCVHAFIGVDKNGKVRIYQTLPWNHVGWHSGVGPKGSANTQGYIGYEICEDALNDKAYFDECMRLADQLDAYLLNKFGLKVSTTTLIDHAEGHKMGIASNHGDIGHWLRKFNMNMNDVRARVKSLMEGESKTAPTPSKPKPPKVDVKYTGNSIVSYLNSIKVDSSMANRKKLATKHGIKNYRGTAKQNLDLLAILRNDKPSSTSQPKPSTRKIAEDGIWGKEVTTALQKALGTPVDGIISGQYRTSITNAISGVSHGNRLGSLMIKALQRKVGARVDGFLGSETITKTQRFLGTPADGKISRPSIMVKEMQRRLNKGTF